MAAGGPKIITSFSVPLPCVDYFKPLPQALPPNLGKLVWSLVARAKTVGFLQAYKKVRGPPEIRHLSKSDHPAAPLVNRAASHGVLISNPRGMTRAERKAALHYGTHTSASK